MVDAAHSWRSEHATHHFDGGGAGSAERPELRVAFEVPRSAAGPPGVPTGAALVEEPTTMLVVYPGLRARNSGATNHPCEVGAA